MDTVEKTFVIKTPLAKTCRYPKFVTLIQEVVDHITQLVYASSIFTNYYFLELLENGEELPVVTQNMFYNIFSIFAGQGKYIELSDKTSPYVFGDNLTVKQRKSLAKHTFQQKINPKSAWPSTLDRIERHETIVSRFLTFWSTYDAPNDTDVPSEANIYAKTQCYMKWLHFIQKEMEQKNYVHRKLQELPFVKKLNTSKYRSLKENILTAINSNKSLEITSKLKNIDKKDIDAVQTFIKTVQTRIQDKTFMPQIH
ncbi:hypothetical protein BCV71DRAFT_279128 [Rhizopus microsporus]|uniref:Uncharacterized protein n=1 Tax=Rhizopus microsporus TaxID=58291 RepID=A0A1X0RMC6_RHIZD|nr:hypothetical protein BCV71DRAFT_279128 [Rhizopus microsporus]